MTLPARVLGEPIDEVDTAAEISPDEVADAAFEPSEAAIVAGARKLLKQARVYSLALQSLSVEDDGLGNIGGSARVTNVGSKPYTGTYTLTFFKSNTSTVIGTAIGSAEEVQPGQTVTVQLASQDPLPAGAPHYDFQVDTEF